MNKPPLARRFLLPLILAVGTLALSGAIYHGAAGMTPGPLRSALIGMFGPLLFGSIWFFAFIGPPLAYRLGAGFVERLVIAFANPIIWIVQVELRLACQFTGVELIYFLFLPWLFGLICVTLLEFSLSELVCRVVHRRLTGMPIKVFHPAVVLCLTAGITGLYFGLIRGQEWVYMVVHHYSVHAM
ncbi:MAG: hypothetical protein JEZ11_08720 [Desulfobacterales bacterium]|nr:hypothetical protein [Desulfobacterales bacterium]